MRRNTIRIVLLLGIGSIIGIIGVQIYFVQKAFTDADREADQSIRIALRSVAEEICSYNQCQLPSGNPIHRQSSDYYIVNINTIIDSEILEHFLVREFKNKNIKLDFEYGIYDCSNDEMVYGSFIKMSESNRQPKQLTQFEKYNEFIYYFGVFFPGRTKYILSNLSIWYFFTFILLLVIIFFGYTQFILLKQKRFSEVQKDFINTITHELKTPLSSISISADVIREKDICEDPVRLNKYAGIIKNQGNHILQQIEKVLQSVDLENNKIQLHQEKLDLEVLLNAIIEDLSPRLYHSKSDLKILYQSEYKMINLDKTHFSNLVNNLIDNSIKYCEQKPNIRIVVHEEEKNLILSFEDNGIGIDKQHQNRVFEKFFRVPTGDVHNVKGFGLGLNYVRNIAHLHHWKIKLESEPDSGTKIAFIIPKKKQK